MTHAGIATRERRLFSAVQTHDRHRLDNRVRAKMKQNISAEFAGLPFLLKQPKSRWKAWQLAGLADKDRRQTNTLKRLMKAIFLHGHPC